MNAFPPEERDNDLKDLDLSADPLPGSYVQPS